MQDKDDTSLLLLLGHATVFVLGSVLYSSLWHNPKQRQRPSQQRQRQRLRLRSAVPPPSRQKHLWVGPRGRAALSPPIPYLGNFLTALDDPCHADHNPTGFIALCVAENKLVLDDLITQRFLSSSRAGTGFTDPVVYTYNSFLGLPVARKAAAYFLARHFLQVPPTRYSHNNNDNDNSSNNDKAMTMINPKFIALGAGCAALINHLFFLLGGKHQDEDDNGDGDGRHRRECCCLIPAPYYAAFENDMNLIAGIVPYPVVQHNPAAGPTEAEWQAAYNAAIRDEGLEPQFILITNPNNPLGTIYTPQVLKCAVDWARSHQMHTIVDEIYALSTHSSSSTVQFTSILQVLDNQLGHDVHFLWAISKDFAASGLRFGLLYSQNEALMEGLATVSIFTCISGPIQYLVAELLTDDVFCDSFLNESRRRIKASYDICIAKLNEMVIPFVPAVAGLFVYVDFSSLLPDKTSFEMEATLSQWLFEYARMVLTPGESQRDPNPGMFRICYAWVSPDVLQIAMERLSRFVAKVRRLPLEFWQNAATDDNHHHNTKKDLARAFAGVLDL